VREARALGLDVVLVGALARDVQLEFRHGIETGRATRDVDVAVAVPSWESFTELQQRLIETGRFRLHERQRQRLRFEGGLWVDFAPFGGVESADRSIAWPPDGEIVMSTGAFREVFEAAAPLELAPDLELKVATLPGLAALKVLAWADRQADRDAHDLHVVATRYLEAGNLDRFFAEHDDLVEVDDFDFDRAGAQLLGRDVRQELGEAVAETVDAILEHELEGPERLIDRMARSSGTGDESWETIRGLLDAMRAGLLGRRGSDQDSRSGPSR